MIVPDIVDEAVFAFIHAIDQGKLHLIFISNTGRKVDSAKDDLGELAGWYMGAGGWRAMYSRERFNYDFNKQP